MRVDDLKAWLQAYRRSSLPESVDGPAASQYIARYLMTLPDPLPCLRARGDGVLLLLSVVPNAKRTEIGGLHDGALRLRLAAPPIDGRANEALVAWIATSLGVPRRSVEVLRGESSRRKQVRIDVPIERAAKWLAGLFDPDMA